MGNPVDRRTLLLLLLTMTLTACAGRTAPAGQPSNNDGLVVLGRNAGALCPDTRDCQSYCEEQWSYMSGAEAESATNTRQFGFGCHSACALSRSRQLGLQCYALFAAPSPQEWRSLYLARGMVEQTVFCLREVGDDSPPARELVRSFDRDQASGATREAVEAENRALWSGNEADAKRARKARARANQNDAWKQAITAFQAWQAPPELGGDIVSCLASLPMRACGSAQAL